jgi:branched-chain amino acid transport system substrate-binding protein
MEKLGWKVPMIGSWTLAMANFIDNAGKNGDGTRMPQTFIQDAEHAEAQVLHRRLRESLQSAGRPHAVGGVGSAGLRLDLPAGRGHEAGRLHRRTEDRRRAGEPEREGRRRGHHLQKPYSKTDHEAINFDNTVFGEVKGGKVVLAK